MSAKTSAYLHPVFAPQLELSAGTTTPLPQQHRHQHDRGWHFSYYGLTRQQESLTAIIVYNTVSPTLCTSLLLTVSESVML